MEVNVLKLEIESESSHVLGLVAKTFEIFSQCKGYPCGKGCHECKYSYQGHDNDIECRVADIEKMITAFSF